MLDDRREFLLKMYDQMFNDINRHILVVWQSIGVIVGAFAIFALVEKGVISADIASSIVILLSAWSAAHIIDASYWYNRNLVIIANIERQFLEQEDTGNIHYYFSKHPKDNKMISHLQIQLGLSIGLTAIVVMYHLSTRVYPGFESSWYYFEPERGMPYLLLTGAILYLRSIHKGKNERYREFLEKSPGKQVESVADDAIGHGQ